MRHELRIELRLTSNSSNFISPNSFTLSARPSDYLLGRILMAYLNYAASSWKDSREDSKSRSPLRRPWCLKSAAQDNLKKRRQSQRTSGFQVAGAPCCLGALRREEYVCAKWNVDIWLSKLDALGCDPASLNKLVHLSKLDPKLASYTVLSFFMRIADGFNSLASPFDNYSAWLMTTCPKATMSFENCGEHK